jgi:hypothetical protein
MVRSIWGNTLQMRPRQAQDGLTRRFRLPLFKGQAEPVLPPALFDVKAEAAPRKGGHQRETQDILPELRIGCRVALATPCRARRVEGRDRQHLPLARVQGAEGDKDDTLRHDKSAVRGYCADLYVYVHVYVYVNVYVNVYERAAIEPCQDVPSCLAAPSAAFPLRPPRLPGTARDRGLCPRLAQRA